MNKTKKGFLIAGCILAIIASAVMLILALSVKSIDGFLTIETLEQALLEEDPGAMYSQEELVALKGLITGFLNVFAIICGGFAIATLIVSIILLVKTSKDKFSKGLTITLLVLSIGMSNLTLIFMIVALCIKDKKENIENQPEIIVE